MAQAKKFPGDRENVHQLWEADLAQAKGHADEAESLGRKSIEAWARCADSILAAIERARAAGHKLTQVDVGRRLGWPIQKNGPFNKCCKVQQLLQWRGVGAQVPHDPPWGGKGRSESVERRSAQRFADTRRDDVLRAVRADPELHAYYTNALHEPDPNDDSEPRSKAEPKMSAKEAMDYVNDIMRKAKEQDAREDAKERKREERSQRREEAKADREHAEYKATARGVISSATIELALNGPRAVRTLPLVTTDVIQQLTPEERDSLLPELVEHLENLMVPVEAALALCRAAATSSKEGDK